MKNLLLIGSLSIVLLSCEATAKATHGATESKLIKIVSVEQGCPVENIKIIDKGRGSYALDVCGKRMVWKQAGTTFMEASKMQVIMNGAGN
ncbi:hypothetical protein [Chryseobacterium sp. EO14]|uniref:hypothetical protein n=1 Tax=Chryseobacterium sp. EO14 TaxID=2950551 RepID=UPI00210A1596|nr:hypothetical protein [Chryseobacterium sp. EO14]MCQ4142005.1 hypothetical protein [Chryseobacterium sp. EO14]